MKGNEKLIVEKLESMTIEDARLAIATGTFGDIGSPNHAFALSWLSVQEASVRDAHEKETLIIASRANKIAIIAILISTITAIVVGFIESR